MDPVLKQRLIGAAVLWLLAFLLLPPLLDSSPDSREVERDLALPESARDVPRETRSISLDVDEDGTDAAPPPSGTAVAEGDGDAAGGSVGAARDAGPAEAATGDARPGDGRSETAVTASAEPSGKPGEQAQPPGASVDPDGAATEESGWAVQVGSFSKRDNAYDLRDRLRSRQYPVMVTEFELEGETLYRVRVGPEDTREAAGRRLQELREQLDLPGRVVSHP